MYPGGLPERRLLAVFSRFLKIWEEPTGQNWRRGCPPKLGFPELNRHPERRQVWVPVQCLSQILDPIAFLDTPLHPA